MSLPSERDYPDLVKELKYYHNGSTRDLNPCNPIWTNANDVDEPTRNTIFCPVKGTGNGDRIGRKVVVLHITISGFIFFNSTVADVDVLQPNLARVMIVRDNATGGDPIDMDNLMLHAKGTLGSIMSIQSGAYAHHFEILHDRLFEIFRNPYNGNVASTEYVGSILPFKFECDYPNGVLVTFNNDVLEAADSIIDNAWFIVAGLYDNPRFPNGALSSKIFPKISWDSVTTYVDV